MAEYSGNSDQLAGDAKDYKGPVSISPNGKQYGEDENRKGFLLSKSDEKVAKRVIEMIEAQEPYMQQRRVQWEVNVLRRKGTPNVHARTDRDGQWFVWKAPNVLTTGGHSVNEAADLCRKLESFLFSDPPASEAQPSSGDDEDIARAELSTRALLDVQGEHGLNSVSKARRAYSRATSFGSGFVFYYFDKTAGGLRPMKIQAGFDAKTQQQAEHERDATRNPETGIEWADYKSRYVRKDGSLTDKESDAAKNWVGKLQSKVLTGRNIRFLPHDCDDIGDAHGVIVVEFVTLGEAERLDPEFFRGMRAAPKTEGAKQERLAEILGCRPDWAKHILRPGQRKAELESSKTKPETLVLKCELFLYQCPEYPKGLHLRTYGQTEVALRESWVAKINGKEEPRILPVAQYGQMDEGRDDPYKVGMMEILGPGNELHQAAWACFLDVLDKTVNRKTFFSTMSAANPRYFQNPSLRYIPTMPGSEPKTEDQPQLPAVFGEVLERVTAQLEKASSMNQTAQALESPSVNSGLMANIILGQVHAQLSEHVQNIEAGWVRGSRIELQFLRADYTIEQQLKWKGDDGDYVLKAWRGSDFGDTTDVRLKPGSLTLLGAAHKEALAGQYMQAGLFQPHEYREIVRSQVGGRIGIEDDPHHQRIKRQLAKWKEGPPEGWAPPEPEVQIGPDGLPVVDPVSGQPAMVAAPNILDSIFAPSPADELPEVAPLRLYEIGRAMASKVYHQKPDAWRTALDAEFERMKAIVYPPPPVEAPQAPPEAAAAEPPLVEPPPEIAAPAPMAALPAPLEPIPEATPSLSFNEQPPPPPPVVVNVGQQPSRPKNKRVYFNRDESGGVVSADVIENEEELL